MKQREGNGAGENRLAIDALAAEIEEKYGVISVADRPLIERAKSLATAVDHDPANSQLQIQLGAALTQLRREVMEATADRYASAIWEARTGCNLHGPNGGIHCGECCAVVHGLDHVELWEPPVRESFIGHSGGLPTREMEDADYARAVVYDFLRNGSRGL